MTDLGGVRWIGGGSGAGKSTVAALLGRRRGVSVVHTDESLHPHAGLAAGDPRVDAFVRMSMDERWVQRDPAEMLESFPWFAGVGFDLLLADLPPARPLIVEGFRLLPRLVAPLLEGGGRAAWLLPTPAMRAAAMAQRAAQGRAFWERTSDPARALANLLERDRRFTERVRADCAALGLAVVEVDGAEGVGQVAARVEGLLAPLG